MRPPEDSNPPEPPAAAEVKSEPKGHDLDLAEAIGILQHAGRPDPTQLGIDTVAQLQAIIDGLCDLSMHDGLTGLVNATFFHAVLSQETSRSARTGRTCCLMVIDADHFKLVNDTYGHNAGDRVLQMLARKLSQSLRGMDTAARIGGEEFAVILPECTPEDGLRAGIRIHAALNPLVVSFDTRSLTLTTSAGLVWNDPAHPASSSFLVDLADQQMYRAKQAGRGCLCHPPLVITEVSPQERDTLASYRSKESLK